MTEGQKCQPLINSLQSVRSTQIEADVELNLEKNL
jgi:hypothetical protein